MRSSIKAFALYAQVALWDVESPDSYAQYVTGKEKFVVSDGGVTLSVGPDSHIDLTAIFMEKADTSQLKKIITTKITVGGKGVEFGNMIAATTSTLPLPAGKYTVTAYADNEDLPNCTQILFLFSNE